MFKGVATALITPFTENGIDYAAYEKLIEYQIRNGIAALLVCGTTGEPATMTAAEKTDLIKFTIAKVAKRVPVIVGTGTNCTATTIENSMQAEKFGADGVLLVTPYYNKCTQEGLFLHYKAVADAITIPAITYNVPGRTGVNISPETCAKLAKVKNIVAIKEACGNIAQIAEVARVLKGTSMELMSGDDGLILPMMAMGTTALISVASNAIPATMVKIMDLYFNGKYAECQDLFFKYRPFMEKIFCEVNPIPIKYACSTLGLCKNILRLPLTPLSEKSAKSLDTVMQEVAINKLEK